MMTTAMTSRYGEFFSSKKKQKIHAFAIAILIVHHSLPILIKTIRINSRTLKAILLIVTSNILLGLIGVCIHHVGLRYLLLLHKDE